MEEARRVLERLARIEELERRPTPSTEVLDELKQLVREAEAWLRVESQPEGAVEALVRCRAALADHRQAEDVVLLAR